MWRALSSYLPFTHWFPVDSAAASTSLPPTFYTDSDSGMNVVAMPRPIGTGYKFSTLSISDQFRPGVGEDAPRTARGTNRVDAFAFEKNGYCCASSILTPSGRMALNSAFRIQVQFVEGQAPQMPPLNIQDFNELYWYAFSPYGDHAFAARDQHSKLASWTFHKPRAEGAKKPTYSSLIRWLTANLPHEANALAKSSLVFGTGASYFAKTESLCTWNDLSNNLDQFLRSKGTATIKDGKAEAIPRLVALGADDDHIAIMKDGSNTWQLNRKHFLRMRIAEGADLDTWERVALNPHNSRDYFLATKIGSIDVGIETLEPDQSLTLSTSLLMYMQAKAREEQRQYEVQIKAGESVADISITPTSQWGRVEMTDKAGERRRGDQSSSWSRSKL